MLGKIVRFDDSEAQFPTRPAPGPAPAGMSTDNSLASAPAAAYPGPSPLEGNPDLDWLERTIQTKTLLFEFSQQERARFATALVRVAQSLCPGAWDAQMRAGQNPEAWPPERMADLVIQQVSSALRNAQLAQNPDLPEKYRQVLSELDAARTEVNSLQQRVQAAETAVRQMKEVAMRDMFRRPPATAKRVEPTPSALRPPPTRPPLTSAKDNLPVSAAPPNLQVLENNSRPPESIESQVPEMIAVPLPLGSGDERVDEIVKTIAETGLCRQKDIRALLAANWSIGNSKNVNRYMGVAVARGYLDIKRVELEWGGQPVGNMAVLTQAGRELALSLGAQLIKSQYELGMPIHMSEEHLYVILEIADILKSESFSEINPFPSRLALPSGSQYHPDLIAQAPDGHLILVEVERKTYKDPRADKWLRAAEAGGGVIHLATPNRDALESIVVEIRTSKGKGPDYPLGLKAFNVKDYRAGQRHADGSLWAYQEQV